MKQALAIGNDAYAGKSRLASCVSDATDVSNCLRSIGFQVHTQFDLNFNSMRAITQRFIQSIQPGSIVLLYYSGHGMQYDGYNFLMPIDEGIYSANVKKYGLSAERLIEDVHTRSPRVVIVILDSCRSYRGPQSLLRTVVEDRAWSGMRSGLAPMRVPPATIVAYASAAERVSSPKSANGRNSLYTYHLLRHIATPNVDMDVVLRNIAMDVQRDPFNTEKQVPYRYSSCNEPIYLVTSPGMMQPGSFFSPFKNPLPNIHSNQYFRTPANRYRDRLNLQFHKPKHHHSAHAYGPAKMMRYPAGFGYPFQRPLYHRRW